MIGLLFFASGLVFFAGLGYALGVLTGLTIACPGRKEHRGAQEKAIALLRSWLTVEQARQWDSQKGFDVIGSDTGTRYHIRYGKAMNIDELDSGGKVVALWSLHHKATWPLAMSCWPRRSR